MQRQLGSGATQKVARFARVNPVRRDTQPNSRSITSWISRAGSGCIPDDATVQLCEDIRVTGRYEFREDLLPICLLRTRCALHAEDAASVFSHFRSLCERRIRFVAISDVRAAERLPDVATYRSFGEEAKRFAVESAAWSMGSAIIIRSPLMRSTLNGLAWLYHARGPRQFICGDMRSAVTWAVATLTTNGIAIPPAVQEFARAQAEPEPSSPQQAVDHDG